MPMATAQMGTRGGVGSAGVFLLGCGGPAISADGVSDADAYVPLADLRIAIFDGRRPARIKRLLRVRRNLCVLRTKVQNELQGLLVEMGQLPAGFRFLQQRAAEICLILRNIAERLFTGCFDAFLDCLAVDMDGDAKSSTILMEV